MENPIDLSCLCTSQVTNSGEYLITLSRGSYNPDIRSWDTSNFLSIGRKCLHLIHHFLLRYVWSIWDTSRVRNMSSMFEDSGFNQDIGEWDTSRVSNMESMFKLSKILIKI